MYRGVLTMFFLLQLLFNPLDNNQHPLTRQPILGTILRRKWRNLSLANTIILQADGDDVLSMDRLNTTRLALSLFFTVMCRKAGSEALKS